MKRQVFFLIVSTVLLASCQREQDWCGAPDINAEVESEQNTRTSISVDESGAGTIYWNPSDKIDVFFGTKKAQYTSQNASDALAATFKTSASLTVSDVSSTNIWGLYPSKSSSSCNGSSITTTLPSTQYGVPNTFDKDIFPAVAHSSSTNLQFYNVCGGIKFNLAYDDIKKITFRGNNNESIAGTISISFVSGVPKATVTSGVKEITLTPKSGTKFVKGADYYITLLPGTLSNGFTMTFTTTRGAVGMLNYTDKAVEIKRSFFSRKAGVDAYAAFADGRQPNNVIYYTTSDGSIVEPLLSYNGYAVEYGANIVSNEYVGGKGIITFNGDVTSIGYYAFHDQEKLTSIWLPESLTSIMDGAFADCSGLTSIDMPDTVAEIGKYAFSNCSGLTVMEIPSTVKKINSFSFQFCTNLTTVIIPNSVSIIGMYAFSNCTSLASVDIPDSVTEIWDGAFWHCSALNSIVIPSSVTSIDQYAFDGCTCLTSIEIPVSVTSIGNNPFSGCTGLSSITVASGNTVFDSRNNCNAIIESATNELIAGCGRTVIPGTVTGIGAYAFYRFSSLTSYEVPAWVSSIGSHAFDGCTSLTSIVDYAASSPSLGNNAFDNTDDCPIYVPMESVNAYKSAWSEYADRIQAIPDTHEAVDLGLPSGVKWATCNVGASSPEEYGDYFAWGETEAKTDYSWSTYRWCNGSATTLTKYNTSNYGTVDNKTVLDLSDDAARANWGGSWRMPTDAEWTELRTQCVWTWTTLGGKNGYNVRGPNGNTIFLPAAGYRDGTSLYYAGSCGNYLSSSLNTDYPHNALYVTFDSNLVNRYLASRDLGQSVRPVYGDFISVESISLNKSSLTIMRGETSQLSATVSPSTATAKTVSWSSSNTNVATVDSDGMVTGLSAGTATITAWASDGEHFATCSVTVQASTPHQASSLVVTGHDVTIQLTSQHIAYSVSSLETMEIRDDMGYPILTNGEWLIGNGQNGIPEGVSAKDYYEIILSLSYDTGALPDMIRSMFSLDWENDQFVLDYSKTIHTCVGTCRVPIMWNISSSLGNYSCTSEIIIKGEE